MEARVRAIGVALAAVLTIAPAAAATNSHVPGPAPKHQGKHHAKKHHKKPKSPGSAPLPVQAAHPAVPCVLTSTIPSADTVTAARAVVLCLVNAARVAAGAGAVSENPSLDRAAQGYASDMAAREFFGHVSPEGTQLADRIRTAGYLNHVSNFGLGEDLGWGSRADATPAALIAAQLADPPHRTVLVDRSVREVGIGVSLGAPVAGAPEPAATIALDFGWTGHPAG